MKPVLSLLLLLFALPLAACVKPPPPYDYTAFRQSNPRSILALPPINNSPDIKASHSVLSQITFPLAESGYYVLPVAVVEETFIQNGLTSPNDIHALPLEKLFQIFKADAVLYIEVKEYGTQYLVITSDTRVTAEAKLVDLRSGQLLWQGSATASTAEQQSNSNGGLIGLLAQAIVEQIANTMTERGHDIAAITSVRLLSAGSPNGILHGPRSPLHGKQQL